MLFVCYVIIDFSTFAKNSYKNTPTIGKSVRTLDRRLVKSLFYVIMNMSRKLVSKHIGG